MKFIHCSDIHLGKTLAGNPVRFGDYFTAFDRLIDRAIEENASLIIIAGDLFHRPSIEPSTLAETVEILEKCKRNKIEVAAVEGNHDRYMRKKDQSWLLYLSKRGFLKLLRPAEDAAAGTVSFEPYDNSKAYGGWIQIDGITIYGLGYWHSSVADQLRRAGKNLPENADVGVLHAGVWDRSLIELGRVSTEELRPLARHFRYVALGHGHRPYEVIDEQGKPFAFNPGALEVVNREEADIEKPYRGGAMLVDTDGWKIETIHVPRRPYMNLKVQLDDCRTDDEALKALEEKLKTEYEKTDLPARPVVMMDLLGKVDFNPTALSVEKAEETAAQIFDPVYVHVQNRLSLVRRSVKTTSTKDLAGIYNETIKQILEEEGRYPDFTDDLVKLCNSILEKNTGDTPTDVADMADFIHNARMVFEKGGAVDE